MDSFEFNKIAGAILGTALGVMAISIIAEGVFSPSEAEKPGLEVAVSDTPATGTTGGGEQAADVQPIAARLASADVGAGETISKKCLACHTLEKGQPAKVGPNLYGVVGGPAAHMAGFNYSEAMEKKKAEGMTWTFENLDTFLTAPKKFVPGTAMGFAGLPKPADRANVIAYLNTLSDSPLPLPAPGAAAPPPAPAGGATAPAPGAAAPPAPDAGAMAPPPPDGGVTPPPANPPAQ